MYVNVVALTDIIFFIYVCIAAVVDLRATLVNGWCFKKKREEHKYTETHLNNIHNRIKTLPNKSLAPKD